MLLSINSTTFLYQFSLFLCLYFQWGENSVFYIYPFFYLYPNYPLFGTPPTKGMNLYDQISRLSSPGKHRLRRFSPDWNGIRGLGSALAERERLLPRRPISGWLALLRQCYWLRPLRSWD